METTFEERLKELYKLAKDEKDVKTALEIALILEKRDNQAAGKTEPEKPTQ